MRTLILILVPAGVIAYLVYLNFLMPKILLWRIQRINKKRNRHKIEKITNNGFTIYIENIPEQVNWMSIKSLEFMANEILIATLRNGKEIRILPECLGRLEFLKKIPPGIPKFDYEYNENFFNSLESCKICGFYAIHNEECLNCTYSIDFENRFIDDQTQESFCKKEQLDYITTYFDNDESVEKTLSKAISSETFIHDKNWKIYPSRQEILEAKQQNR